MSLFQMFTKKDPIEGIKSVASPKLGELDSEEIKEEVDVEREIIQPKIILSEQNKFDLEAKNILIKARLERDEKTCTFLLNRSLIKGYSWVFKEEELEKAPDFIKNIFSLGKIKLITVYESNLIVEKLTIEESWQEFAKEIGKIIRDAFHGPVEIIPDSILKEIPSEIELREKLEEIIVDQINPSLASHGGDLKIQRVHGNTVYLKMGGGCQGCSSAGDTIKYGVQNSFRENLNYLGAIFDETDHSSGENPYFS